MGGRIVVGSLLFVSVVACGVAAVYSLSDDDDGAAHTSRVGGAVPYLTVATRPESKAIRDRVCTNVLTLLNGGFEVRLIGWNSHFSNLLDKSKASFMALREFDAREIVVFGDGYDVALNSGVSATELRQMYERVFDGALLYGTEVNCYALDLRRCQYYPKGRGKHRYLNSGVWMGRAKQAQALFLQMLRGGALQAKGNDQYEVQVAFVEGNRHNISLDYESRFARTFVMAKEGDVVPDELRGGWKNGDNHEHPYFLHFNGAEVEKDTTKVSGLRWWSKIKARLSTAKDGEKKSLFMADFPSCFHRKQCAESFEWQRVKYSDICYF